MTRFGSIAIVGKDNEPLFVKTFAEDSKSENGLRFHYHSHAALDVIEEKLNYQKKAYANYAAARELFLGLLFAVEDCKVYGYATNTKIKFVLVLVDSTMSDGVVKAFMKDFHDLYVDTMSNPFASLNSKVESPRFDLAATQLVASYEKRAGGTIS